MKVSVIIPVYNAEKYLEECLNSVIAQTIEKKEIICIDDGSTDSSYNILEQYQKQYPYIRIFRQENRGAGEARNIGLRAANGKYTSFLDADDFYIESDALERMVSACEKNKLYACAGLRKLYKEGQLIDFPWFRDYFENERNREGVIIQYKEKPDDYFYTNYIFALEIIKKNKILFPSYRRYEDPLFFLKAMILMKEYIVMPVEFYGYRFPEEALNRKETYIEDTLKGIRDNFRLAQKNYLYKLEEKLVDRIGLEYFPGIIRQANEEILAILLEIQEMVSGENKLKEYEEMQTVSLDQVICMTKFKLKDKCLGDYFEEKGITDIAIYGLGQYGKLFIEEIGKSKEINLYGVDQKIRKMEGIKIRTLEETNKSCDQIIVTPTKNNEKLTENIKKVWKGKVWGLKELFNRLVDDN